MSVVNIKEIDGVEIIQYQPQGVCAKMMQIAVKEDIIQNVEVIGGCAGNLSGIGNLVKGMNINEVITRLQGIPCGARPTSCPDQMTKALVAYKEAKSGAEVNVR
jgi:uncharacterized protein (TIGR03905 family)